MELPYMLLAALLLPIIIVLAFLLFLLAGNGAFCRHGPWQILGIGWDGTSLVKCKKCGKQKEVPLK